VSPTRRRPAGPRHPVPRHAFTLSLLTLATPLLGTGCDRAAPSSPPRPPLNVLLISLDTTRADHLGCYGNPAIQTPHIDRLAREGVRFETCISSAPITMPSHASILTGVHPFVHCVRDNGSYRLPDEATTLAEVLAARRYHTWAQVAAFVLHHSFGLGQGFDFYRDVPAVAAGDGEPQIPATAVTDGALELLTARPSEPFFLFVHYFDPHAPYRPPEEFARQYTSPYAGEIAYVDQQIGRLLAALETSGALDRTLIVLTADHGEALGEHGEETHGYFVYRSTLRVPLIFWRPGRVPEGMTVAARVRTVDIAPTILGLLGVTDGLPAAQGADLRLTWRPGATPDDYPTYSETLYPKTNLGYAPLRALEIGDWKYVHGPRPELYNLKQDRLEKRDLAAQEPERVARLADELRTFVLSTPSVCTAGAAAAAAPAAPGAAPPALAALGYVGGVGGAALNEDEAALLNPTGPNPMDLVDEIRAVNAVVPLIWRGEHAATEKAIREILAAAGPRAAGFAWAHGTLAAAIAAQGRIEEAADAAHAAVNANPEDGRAWGLYGLLLQQLGRLDEAREAYSRAEECEPVAAFVLTNFARLCAARQEHAQAARLFRKSLDTDGAGYQDADLVAACVTSLRADGREQDAAEVIETALRVAKSPAARKRIEALRR